MNVAADSGCFVDGPLPFIEPLWKMTLWFGAHEQRENVQKSGKCD